MCDCCGVSLEKDDKEASEKVEEIRTEIRKKPKLL